MTQGVNKMKRLTQEELDHRLVLHQKWRNSEEGGQRLHLVEVDISSHSFNKVDISYAIFERCEMHHMMMEDAIIEHVEFTDSNLKYSFGFEARIRYSKFTDCNLSFVNFDQAALESVEFVGCNLEKISICGCYSISECIFDGELNRCNFAGSSFFNCEFERQVLKEVSFQGSDLVNTSFNSSDLIYCNLLKTNIASCSFVWSRFINTSLCDLNSFSGRLDKSHGVRWSLAKWWFDEQMTAFKEYGEDKEIKFFSYSVSGSKQEVLDFIDKHMSDGNKTRAYKALKFLEDSV